MFLKAFSSKIEKYIQQTPDSGHTKAIFILHDQLNLDFNDLNFNHKVESFQSDTLVIISVSNPDLPEDDIKMEVRPYSESVLRIRN